MIEGSDRRFFLRLAVSLAVMVPAMMLAAFVSPWWLPLVVAGAVGLFASLP